jgi:hypothetical protein
VQTHVASLLVVRLYDLTRGTDRERRLALLVIHRRDNVPTRLSGE